MNRPSATADIRNLNTSIIKFIPPLFKNKVKFMSKTRTKLVNVVPSVFGQLVNAIHCSFGSEEAQTTDKILHQISC